LRAEQRLTTLSFGLDRVNEPPTAVDDRDETFEGVSVEIDVAANDTDPDSQIDRSSIVITDDPLNGQVRIDEATNNVIYIPDSGHQGWDVFGYSIKDEFGAESERARVDVFVAQGVGLLWQNAEDHTDVNNDKDLSPLDALQVINFLIANGARRLTPDDAVPPPFLDVSGDGSVTAIDALQVLNELILRDSAAEGEFDDGIPATARPPLVNDASPVPFGMAFSSNYAAAIDAIWLERNQKLGVR
jgi:hypothetical protein